MTAPFQLLPPLSEDDYLALKEDIAANGVRVPIDVDPWGRILDGHHRDRICRELGIEAPKRVVEISTDVAAREHALSVNTARRHLNREQTRDVVAASLIADPGLSDRAHARRCCVSPTTVGTVRRELEAAEQLSKLDTRVGQDGRLRPVARPRSLHRQRWPYPTKELLQEAMAANGIAAVIDEASWLPMPGMDSLHWDRFCQSVARDGISMPILVTEDGTLIDGRSRLIASLLTGRPVKRRTLASDVDAQSWWRTANIEFYSRPPDVKAQMEAMGDAFDLLQDLDWRIDGEAQRQQVVDGFLTIGQDLKALTYLDPDEGGQVHLTGAQVADALTLAVRCCVAAHPEIESGLRELVDPVIWTFSPAAEQAGVAHVEAVS